MKQFAARTIFFTGSAVGFFLGFLTLILYPSSTALAGIYSANNEVTYIEYWIPHSQFTGGFQPDDNQPWRAKAGCPNRNSPGSFYLEPWPSRDVNNEPCVKTVEFQIPDSLDDALRAEVYLDLWRNQSVPQARFALNDGPLRAPDLGDNWSRNGWVGEIPLAELEQGTNTMRVETASGGFHIHDIAIRVYFDGEVIGAPTGALTNIRAGGVDYDPAVGGVLDVRDNIVTLTADVTSDDVNFVEFHGYYEGYDEDNDGRYRDWHNRGRNNWYPGGQTPQATGGTIDHIGSVSVNGGGTYSKTWSIPHIHNQSGVRFKIRLVKTHPNNTNAYIVREAAGNVSGEFTLARDFAVMPFYSPYFSDEVLCHRDLDNYSTCRYEEEYILRFPMPVDVGQFDQAFLLGSYWNNPWVQVNSGAKFRGTAGFDSWAVGIQPRAINELVTGDNTITYRHVSGFGEFIEQPGPLIVMAQSGTHADSLAPSLLQRSPFANQSGVSIDEPIRLVLSEIRNQIGHGIDIKSVQLTVNGEIVVAEITGFANEYTVSYSPDPSFDYSATVTVEVFVCDLAENCLTESYEFFTEGDDTPFDGASDDFNACTVDDRIWTWIDPQAGTIGESTFGVNGSQIQIVVNSETEHDVWLGGNQAPRLMQDVNNANFEIVTKFDSDIGDVPYSMQGLLFEQDANNYVRINFQRDGTGARLFAAKFEDDVPTPLIGSAGVTLNPIDGKGPIQLRVTRDGPIWQLAYRFGEDADDDQWRTDSSLSFSHGLLLDSVGIFAGNAGSSPPGHTVTVDYFFNSESPIDPEDAVVLRFEDLDLSVVPTEGGQIAPSSANPSCGTPLSIIATPADNQKFAGWQIAGGPNEDLTYENPLVRSFMTDDQVTARFEQVEAQYQLVVDVAGSGNGLVTVNDTPVASPPEVYSGLIAGDQVTLRATAALDGSRFAGWSGALPSHADPTAETLILVIEENATVTATFVKDSTYVLLPIVEPGEAAGSIDVDPARDEFEAGESAELTARPAEGWLFLEWAGDLSGSTNPVTVMITADTRAVARFVEAPKENQLYLPIVERE